MNWNKIKSVSKNNYNVQQVHFPGFTNPRGQIEKIYKAFIIREELEIKFFWSNAPINALTNYVYEYMYLCIYA